MDRMIRVREGGKITLPAKLFNKYNIEKGDVFNLVDLDGMFAFVPVMPVVSELANVIEHLREEAGMSMEELMQNLRTQREQYNRENYGM